MNTHKLTHLKKIDPRKLDETIHRLHHDTFENTNCLECANCCKTTSPMFNERDIDRLAKHLKIKPSIFIEKYLKKDEDGDWVYQSTPCPFLGYDNYCSVYEHRPAACREYPHTDRKKQIQLLNITEKNTLICPAVASIVDQLLQTFPPQKNLK